MNNPFLKKQIKSAIFNLLKEEVSSEDKKKDADEKPEKEKKKAPPTGEIKIASGAVGRGSFKKFVREAGARSTKDPKGLMKDLGVEKAPSGNDLEKLQQILSVSTNVHPAMKDAYLGVTGQRETINGRVVQGLSISVNSIGPRDGMKFILHTLMGAKNAGLLNLEGAVEIGKSDKSPIFVYSL